MVRNLGSKPSASDPEALGRFERFIAALNSAGDSLQGSDPAIAEKKAKALSAVVRAACDIEAWRALVFAETAEGADEQRAASRAFQARIDRILESSGYPAVFGGSAGD